MKFIRIFIFAAVLVFTSNCTKRNEFNDETAQAAVDMHNMGSAMDELVLDANFVMGDQYLLRGKVSGGMTNAICGVTIDTSLVHTGVCYINYIGEECNKRRRAGSIKLSILNYPAAKWKQKGCVVKLELTNYSVVSLRDGKKYLFNGTLNLTNESGGGFYDLFFLHQPVLNCKYSSDGLFVKYDDDNVSSTYGLARKMSFSANSNKLVFCSVEGLGSYEGKRSDSWGQTRVGGTAFSQITTPIDWRSDCGPASPVAGTTVVKRTDRDYEFTSRMGTNEEGSPSLVPVGQCPFGYKIEWTYSGNTTKRVFEFYH